MKQRPRDEARRALAWAMLLTGCSRYVGRDPLPDAAMDAPHEAASNDAPSESVPARKVCGDYGLACDPITHGGCAAGLACVITSLLPATAECAAPGARTLGAGCDARVPSTRCAAGLQCLSGRCLRPCCAQDDARCSATNALSACAVSTHSETIYGCTLAAACTYRPQAGCPTGAQCFPQTEFGEAICRPVAGNADGDPCVEQNDCAAGLTCIYFGATAGVGVCRPACNPRDQRRCASSRCARLNDRPADFGACE